MLILFSFGFLMAILNVYFVFSENVELIVTFIVPFDLWIIKLEGMPHELSLYMSINFKLIADIVFSVVAILNFNLDYEKKIVYSLGNGFI